MKPVVPPVPAGFPCIVYITFVIKKFKIIIINYLIHPDSLQPRESKRTCQSTLRALCVVIAGRWGSAAMVMRHVTIAARRWGGRPAAVHPHLPWFIPTYCLSSPPAVTRPHLPLLIPPPLRSCSLALICACLIYIVSIQTG